MGKEHSQINEEDREFIENQKLFFVCTSPLDENGHINLSPKGFDCFQVLSPGRVGYIDIIGSGNETSAHLLENGRITFMFCAFNGPPKILRLYGKGKTVLPGDDEWEELSKQFTILPATRQIIVADIFNVKSSCGFGVPLYEYTGERDHAFKWAEKKGPDGLEEYKKEKNMVSMDGLPTALSFT
ncbi:MAG TPA: pyridoxamine 5'-phosphate oxidase family protein [Chitinophagaceae bacterium]|nr:pyridoxamine 5'-phosphate oxidase family protein [Chitinophagaceae bacterium]